ncbi:unnamed protein product, partial [Thelazia callipaeda]|uniref:Uncharacterized protein n=1 Tax=Thelazia callipaeda TaxID=103827 RepID=A0A0N5D3L1_THECL
MDARDAHLIDIHDFSCDPDEKLKLPIGGGQISCTSNCSSYDLSRKDIEKKYEEANLLTLLH